jgi:hypothetical protein
MITVNANKIVKNNKNEKFSDLIFRLLVQIFSFLFFRINQISVDKIEAEKLYLRILRYPSKSLNFRACAENKSFRLSF